MLFKKKGSLQLNFEPKKMLPFGLHWTLILTLYRHFRAVSLHETTLKALQMYQMKFISQNTGFKKEMLDPSSIFKLGW